MRKIAVLVLSAFMFASCGAMYSVRPAEAFVYDGNVGAWFGKAIWGTVKGCCKAWNAPEKAENGSRSRTAIRMAQKALKAQFPKVSAE